MLETQTPTPDLSPLTSGDPDPQPPASAAGPAGAARRWWALAVLCLSLIVVTIDTTILNVALPSLQAQLRPSSSGLEWIVDAYTVVFAGLLLTAGALGDRYGRKGALTAGLAVFAVASAASALAQDPSQLIGLRALTGVGAALIFPATLSILTNVFTDPVERQRAIAVWAGTAGIGIGLGPVVGGLLLRHFYWGAVFWVNVPVCVLAIVAGHWLIPTSRDPGHSVLDVWGAALSIVGLSTLVFAIIEGPSKGWTSTEVLGAFAVAAVVLAAFVLVELRRRHPMIDLRLFENPRFQRRQRGGDGAVLRAVRNHLPPDPVPADRARLRPARRRIAHASRSPSCCWWWPTRPRAWWLGSAPAPSSSPAWCSSRCHSSDGRGSAWTRGMTPCW